MGRDDPTGRAVVDDDGGHVLDNPVWGSLTGYHRNLAEAAGRARRYRLDVSVFSAVDHFDDDSWADLARLAGPGAEVGLLRSTLPTPPTGWDVSLRGTGQQMVVNAGRLQDVEPIAMRPLTEADLPQMLELVGLTLPGPFLARTIETGRYVGHLDANGRLLAMAGERFRPAGYTEVSAVCTHPDARGRGLGAAVTHHVAGGILERGDQPFLHVADANVGARRLYERLGFESRRTAEFMLAHTPTGPTT